ncbi:MAG: hypothetical protein JO288_17165 [Hyphomicrobiales bacterium]|nr:hypothetical protein [Hyphomicrobiales bacterium]
MWTLRPHPLACGEAEGGLEARAPSDRGPPARTRAADAALGDPGLDPGGGLSAIDGAIQRWQALAGEDARLDPTGETFARVARATARNQPQDRRRRRMKNPLFTGAEPADEASSAPEEAEEKVGPGWPPRRTRLAPGQSGNPRGRPKRARAIGKLIARAFDQTVDVPNQGSKADGSSTIWRSGAASSIGFASGRRSRSARSTAGPARHTRCETIGSKSG